MKEKKQRFRAVQAIEGSWLYKSWQKCVEKITPSVTHYKKDIRSTVPTSTTIPTPKIILRQPGSLSIEGRRLISLVQHLHAASYPQTNEPAPTNEEMKPIQEALSASIPPTGLEQASLPKRLFSAMDLKNVSLKSKCTAQNAAPTTKDNSTSSAPKSKLLFSAFDLGKIQLKKSRRLSSSSNPSNGCCSTLKSNGSRPQGEATKPIPLAEQLKRALQKKFFKVQATPCADTEDESAEEWL